MGKDLKAAAEVAKARLGKKELVTPKAQAELSPSPKSVPLAQIIHGAAQGDNSMLVRFLEPQGFHSSGEALKTDLLPAEAPNTAPRPEGSLETFIELWVKKHLSHEGLPATDQIHPITYMQQVLRRLAAALREAGHAR